MIERRTLLDILEKNQKLSPTSTNFSQTLTPVFDEQAEEIVDDFLRGIQGASSNLMDNIQLRIDSFLQNDLRELTGQDIVIVLLQIEQAFEEIDRVLAQLRIEQQLAQMSYDDAYNEAYQKLLDGTVKDRHAYAEGKTAKLRYLSFAKNALVDSLSRRFSSQKKQVALIEKLLWQGIRGD